MRSTCREVAWAYRPMSGRCARCVGCWIPETTAKPKPAAQSSRDMGRQADATTGAERNRHPLFSCTKFDRPTDLDRVDPTPESAMERARANTHHAAPARAAKSQERRRSDEHREPLESVVFHPTARVQ